MVKNISIVLLCMAMGSVAYADILESESDTFIGVEVGLTEVQGEQPSDTSDDVSYGIRVGAQNEQWRTIIGFNYYDSDEYNVEKILLSVDYFFLKYDEMANYMLQPYIGANVGYMNYEQGIIDESGLLYGGQIGIVLNFMDKFDLDLGYRYSLSDADVLDHSSDVLLGIHYHF